jgi:hypothetical protein
MAEYRKEVDDLLKLYAKYKELLFIEADLSTKRAKQKIIGVVDAELVNDHETAKKNLQRLSDSMTFSNPFVWILYKFEAYKNEAQSIRTIRDFRIHCSKVGDICTKRFLFVNEQLTQKDQPTLMDDLYDGSLLLNALLKDKYTSYEVGELLDYCVTLFDDSYGFLYRGEPRDYFRESHSKGWLLDFRFSSL